MIETLASTSPDDTRLSRANYFVLEGRILARQREIEGPFGEFPGQYSGCRNYPVIEIDRVSHCKDPLYEALYLGMPWTELDYMCAVNTSAPLHVQLQNEIPEIVAVNAIYTLGFIIIVSTKTSLRQLRQGCVPPRSRTHKMVIDATTPVPPDDRGSFGEQLGNPPQTDAWRTKLGAMLKDLHK